ncbi:phosphotransferase [Microbacterium mangrovi]|nr:phosphotransferase [Microbacterium mangrovi]
MSARQQAWTSDSPETPLLGGDVTVGVVRSGDTVRRPPGISSPAVRVLLEHLEETGFDGAPRYLGVDDRGRDVLSFIEGETAGRPAPEWVADTDRAISVARLLRRYHDAVASLGVPTVFDGARLSEPQGLPPALEVHRDLIGHRDITVENVVFREGAAVGLIDFDLARASSRADDICNMLQWWAPWMPAEDRPGPLIDVDPYQRTRAMLDAYSLDPAERRLLVPLARNGAERSWHLMRHRALVDGGGWRRMWDEGVGDAILRRQEWLRRNERSLIESVS